MSKWTAIKDEPIPEGNSPVYVTDGTRVSFVKRAAQADTEVEKWIVAEPEAEHLKFPPLVSNPTHWATVIPGLPKVDEKDVPVVTSGGPPPRTDPDEKINFPDPLDHDGDGKKGGSK